MVFRASAQQIGCFVRGECKDSLYIDVQTVADPQACLDFCKTNLGCNYFTHYSVRYVHMYTICITFNF